MGRTIKTPANMGCSLYGLLLSSRNDFVGDEIVARPALLPHPQLLYIYT